jgi:hypothetical protein
VLLVEQELAEQDIYERIYTPLPLSDTPFDSHHVREIVLHIAASLHDNKR